MTKFENGDEQFVHSLFLWYEEHKRDLPWRQTRDPYKIWVSEIILQQTRIEQGMDYYLRFIAQWPTVEALASANEDALMKAWEGLGYYNRARNMHETAKYVNSTLGGQFPKTYEGLLALKGIGPYTAAAIASFAFGLPHPVVDGNVYRVMSRIKNLDVDIAKPNTRQIFVSLLEKMISGNDPALFNNALMEFGALQCTPRNPDCSKCFYSLHCLAYKEDTVQQRPVKTKKLKRKTRYLHFFLQENAGRQWVKKRTEDDIWAGLYAFPSTETPKKPKNLLEILPNAAIREKHIQIFSTQKHLLTHQVLHIHYWFARLDSDQMKKDGFKEMSHKELEQLSFPRPLRGIFKKM